MHDLGARPPRMASVSPSGVAGDSNAFNAALDDSGDMVAFEANGSGGPSNLSPQLDPLTTGIVVRRLSANTTSVAQAGAVVPRTNFAGLDPPVAQRGRPLPGVLRRRPRSGRGRVAGLRPGIRTDPRWRLHRPAARVGAGGGPSGQSPKTPVLSRVSMTRRRFRSGRGGQTWRPVAARRRWDDVPLHDQRSGYRHHPHRPAEEGPALWQALRQADAQASKAQGVHARAAQGDAHAAGVGSRCSQGGVERAHRPAQAGARPLPRDADGDRCHRPEVRDEDAELQDRALKRRARRCVGFALCAAASPSRAISRCRCHGRASYCKYCAFATHQPHLYAPDEVERMLDDAARRGVKELLVLTGERPEVNEEVARAARGLRPRRLHLLRGLGCERGSSAGLLPHTNLGALARRPRAAARGDRVAGPDVRVGARPPGRAPGLAHQAPGAAARDDRAAGELRIPFTSGILVGIGETEEERMAALEALAEVHGGTVTCRR